MLLALAGVWAGCDAPLPPEPAPLTPAPPSPSAVDGDLADRWIVVFNDDVGDPASLADAMTAPHGKEIRHVYRHALKGFAARLPEVAVEAISRNPNVKYVEPDGFMRPDHVQDPAPWHLDRIDQRQLPLNGRYNYFWTGGGSDVSIYIIDSGVKSDHPEFGDRVVDGYTAIHDGMGTEDCTGHGTGVASMAAGNTVGVAKEAWIWPVRVWGCYPDPVVVADVIAGIDWVAGNHFKPAVANLSYSHADPPGCTNEDVWWKTWCGRSIEDAVTGLVAEGVGLVTSAGNSAAPSWAGDDACDYSPNRMAEVISVGATNSQDGRAKWTDGGQTWSSNWGSCIDIWAPGRSVEIAGLGGGLTTWHGTSYASPAVAGALALFLDEDPDMTVQQLRTMLQNLSTSTTIGDAGAGSPHRLLYTINFRAGLGGPGEITQTGWYQWEALYWGAGSNEPTAYEWEYRPVSEGTWQAVGTGETYDRYVETTDSDFELRVTVNVHDISDSHTRLIEIGLEPCDPSDPLCPT